MPRISPQLLRRLWSTDISLAKLLPVCRNVASAQNEFRWLKEHVANLWPLQPKQQHAALRRLVDRRAQHEPLQYILGSEFFGDLQLLCRPGVLIPRQETAASVTHLANLISGIAKQDARHDKLRVLDLCTGSGCMTLLFNHEYNQRVVNETELECVGVDISTQALELAKSNLELQIMNGLDRKDARLVASLQQTKLLQADIMSSSNQSLFHSLTSLGIHSSQILMSNPPYISTKQYRATTARSVRRFEPRLALVPRESASDVEDGDQFYPRLWSIADDVQAQMVLFEVVDIAQAMRVAEMARSHRWDRIEIWRDDPTSELPMNGTGIPIVGSGNGRSVFASRGEMHRQLCKMYATD